MIANIIDTAVDNNIGFHLYPKASHQGCAGTFDEKMLYACTKREDWLGILVHESCHMDQFLEKSKLWFTHNDIMPDGEHANVWEPEHRKRHPVIYKRAFTNITKLEIDCDNRAIYKIKQYKLDKTGDIDLKGYIQQANCYHASYYYFHKWSCFYDPKYVPYRQGDLYKLFPDDRICSFKEAWKPNKELGEYIKRYNKPL